MGPHGLKGLKHGAGAGQLWDQDRPLRPRTAIRGRNLPGIPRCTFLWSTLVIRVSPVASRSVGLRPCSGGRIFRPSLRATKIGALKTGFEYWSVRTTFGPSYNRKDLTPKSAL